MILTELAGVTVYRMHVPRWAVAPTSGVGAGTHGGRANRVGLNALYLALDHDTAIREYQQLSSLMPPGTLVSYNLTAAPIVDFTGGYESEKWSDLWEDFYCDWRRCWFNERIEPPMMGSSVSCCIGMSAFYAKLVQIMCLERSMNSDTGAIPSADVSFDRFMASLRDPEVRYVNLLVSSV